MSHREILEAIDQMIAEETEEKLVFQDANQIAWGMCVGAIDALDRLRRLIVESEQ